MDSEKIHVCKAEVISNVRVAKDIWQLTLEPPDQFVVTDCSPGQFVCLAPFDANSAMSRPFSIASISTFNGTLKLIYKLVGVNTKLMGQLNEGQQIKFWGPLGNGFIPDPQSYEETWLIGGGMGIAPLRFFEKVISEYQEGIAKVFYGAKSKDEIIDLQLDEDELTIATDDGSAGYRGLVTHLFFDKTAPYNGKKILVITCGPNRMMNQIAALCGLLKFDCYVILERIMACGIGVCLGCSIKMKSGEMKRICHDGPVFKAEEVDWNALG